MTIIARSAQQAQSETRRVRIQASEPLFFQAFAHGYGLAQQDYDGQPLTDDTLYGYIRRTMTQPDLSPRWKAGAITGWFAALYHIPCTFEEQTTRPKPKPAPATPRPIELHYTDPHFMSAYEAGYAAFAAVVGDQPATDDGLYAELARDFQGARTLTEARWCAGYLAGFMAALFRVSCFVEDRHTTPSLASVERISQ